MSQNLSESDGNSQPDYEPEDSAFDIYGMYFCGLCKNLMTPGREQNEKLEFNCKLCAKKTIDFSNATQEQCIIYNKELKAGSKSSKAEKEFIFDPTLPKILVECPECGGDEACYIVTPDEGETSIEVQLICTNFTRCDKVWVLEPSFALENFEVIEKE